MLSQISVTEPGCREEILKKLVSNEDISAVDLKSFHPRWIKSIKNQHFEIMNIYKINTHFKQNISIYNAVLKTIKYKKEKILFHGTKLKNIDKIIYNGFNSSYNVRSRYGKGTYFTNNPSIAASYCDSQHNLNGNRVILVCRVIIGKSGLACANRNKNMNSDTTYDSMVDNVRDPSIFVINRDYHAIPLYVAVCQRNRIRNHIRNSFLNIHHPTLPPAGNTNMVHTNTPIMFTPSTNNNNNNNTFFPLNPLLRPTPVQPVLQNPTTSYPYPYSSMQNHTPYVYPTGTRSMQPAPMYRSSRSAVNNMPIYSSAIRTPPVPNNNPFQCYSNRPVSQSSQQSSLHRYSSGRNKSHKKKIKKIGPPMCEGGCGFYGNRNQRNCCNKCYKNMYLPTSDKSNDLKQQASSCVAVAMDNLDNKPKRKTQKKKNRCWFCRKKVNLSQKFECKCGYIFCGSHRYPDAHKCDFDWKTKEKYLQSLRTDLFTAATYTMNAKLR